MNPLDREKVIVDRAIEHFSAEGFAGSTRELARKIGITQSLLYRYFPTKEALLDRVYERVYMARWNPLWEEQLRDRSIPIEERLKGYYVDYAHTMLQNHWVRILVFAGLKQAGINERLFAMLRERIYKTVQEELRESFELPPPRTREESEIEMELVWALHASIFYLGMRRWVYNTAVPTKITPLIEVLVEGFIESFKHLALKRQRTPPPK
ncbi:MAG TPA: TetR/AcrR family transcriptional regulator [Ramlibacter sp.]|nr:TetR/AcrR family transcriptional regulator [Ramlibacter sp.]